jgi:hypothetical protein
MSRLRSHLSPRIVLALFVIVLGGSWIAIASSASLSVSRTELGTPEQQAAVRTSRDVSGLPLQSACTVVPEKELFVREVSVVDDCLRTTWHSCISSGGTVPIPATQGAWTFGARMQSLAGTTDPAKLSTFTLNWLHHWQVDQTINSDPVPARTKIKSLLIDPWLAASGGSILDMKKAPFRLLAIVARLDLRENAGYSGGTSAGEARFIYNLLDLNNDNATTQFNVIFEYGLDAADCAAVQNWADLWHGLGSHTFGPDYNAALQAVTDRFATIGASPGKPNGSALNQLRTNEVQLVLPGSTLWELREFKLSSTVTTSGAPAPLVQGTVAQTPARSLNQTTAISTYANANAPAILANNYVVPLVWSGAPFRGGAAPNHLELGWDGPPPACSTIPPNVRFNFSVNTCSGCHGIPETNTTFKQVEPRNAGSRSDLAAFLTGESGVPDFCSGQPSHSFNDIERRRVDLCQLLNKTCTEIDSEPVVTFVH